MRLNWFSSLLPSDTDAARHTVWLLPALRERAEVTLWTDQAEWDPALGNCADVRRYQLDRMPWTELNKADMSIYQVDNGSPSDGTVWQVSRRYPGVIILHDFRLQDFLASRFQDWRQDHGVLVHTREAFSALKQEDRWPVAYVPLPINGAGRNGRCTLKGRHAPETYADALMYFVDYACRLRPRAMANYLADRVGMELGAWVGPVTSNGIFKKVAEEIHAMFL